MPFTPFHFGPWSAAALPLGHRIDLPVFLLVNFVIDLEPFAALFLGWDVPVHGLFHTFTFGALIGLAWAAAAWPFRGLFKRAMDALGLAYEPRPLRTAASGVLGIWSHVLLDSTLYAEMRPFWPLAGNPLHGLVREPHMYAGCALAFVPAAAIYLYVRAKGKAA